MCVTICGRFRSDEGTVADYGNRIRVKYTAKWGVQIAGMILGAGSKIHQSFKDHKCPNASALNHIYLIFK